MTTNISKKTISDKAKLLHQKCNLTHAQCLHEIAKDLGFKNYEHYNKIKKFKIAVHSGKGGVGKTSTSRNLYKDLNADHYFRTNYTMSHTEDKFCQIFPTIKKFNRCLPNTKLSAIYDLCRYTNFDEIEDVLQEIDLSIIPTWASECKEPWSHEVKNTLKELYQYGKPIIILIYGQDTGTKTKDNFLIENFKNELSGYKDIHYIYMRRSEIFKDKYVYNKSDLEAFYSDYKEYDIDFKAKSILEICNESPNKKRMFKSIYGEYLQFLGLIERIIKDEESI